jgi:hypothetical protein
MEHIPHIFLEIFEYVEAASLIQNVGSIPTPYTT